MPTFQGQMSEDDLMKLLAYVKSIGQATTTGASNTGAATTTKGTTQ
jgi:hypothetical protein